MRTSSLALAALFLAALLSVAVGAATPPDPLPGDASGALPPAVPASGSGGPLSPGDPAPNDAPWVNLNMSVAGGDQNEVTIAVDMAGRLLGGWNDWASGQPDYRCGLATSLDRGLSFEPSSLWIESGYDAAGDPVAVTDAVGRTYFICMSFNRSDYSGSLFVQTSLDGGQTFISKAEIGIRGLSNLDDKPWGAAYGDGIVVVVWGDFDLPIGTGTHLVSRTSFDAGLTWTAPVDVTTFSNGGSWSALDFDRYGRLHLVYAQGGSLRYRYSDDFGLSYSTSVSVATLGTGCGGCTPRSNQIPGMAVSPTGQDIYATWSGNRGDTGGENIYLAYSHDRGANWTTRQVGDDPTNRQFMPWVDVDHDGVVHLLWGDMRSGQHATYYANSTDGGVTISDDTRVSAVEAPAASFIGDYQQVVVDDWGRVHLAYCDSRNSGDAYYARADLATPGPHWVEIDPLDPTVAMGTTQQFTATVRDPYGNTPPDAVEWRISGGGAIDATGLFTPSALGTYTVTAYAGFRFNATTVTVVPGPLDHIDVVPASAVIAAGATRDYDAYGYDAWNNPVPGFSPTWQRNGGGTINAAGVFTGQVAGDWTVYANQSGVSGSAQATVVPGPLASITVTPPTASITADQTQLYAATGADAYGNPVPIAPTWASTNGSIAAGLFTPWAVGTHAVYANESGISGSASVTVTAGAFARIDVTPDTATITADQTQPFTATGYDARGNVVPIAPVWSANGGSVDGAGLYTPTPVGTWVVTATEGVLFDSASVTVTPGALATLTISPPTATITADQTQPFTVTGTDAKGNPVTPNPVWTVDGGSIDGSGLYTPDLVGAWTVTATDGLVSDTATVTVVPGALAAIVVSPPTATITADQTQPFTATGYDAKGNVVSILPTWQSTGGLISGSGIFTPDVVGTYTVYANQSGISGNATVTVTPGLAVSLVVTPAFASITADQTQAFTATGYDAWGNVAPVSPTWTTDGGLVDASGLYTPGPVGTYVVTATDGSLTDTASVTVSAGALASLIIIPDVVLIDADQTWQFTAYGFDARGNPVPVSPTWAAGGGSISGSGLYTPGPVGTFLVYANESALSATATITVTVGAVASVVVVPSTATITVDETQQYTATAYDVKGNPVGGTFAWSAAAGSVASGLYTPGPLGTFSVYATLGGITGSASVTVTVGALVRIEVTPPTATITADETQQYAATGYDSHDNPIAFTPTWTTSEGSISIGGLYTPTLAGTHEVRATFGGLFGVASVTVLPGALATLEVSPAPTVTLTADQTQGFTAIGRDAQGNEVAVTPVWTTTGGSIDPSGLFQPGSVGTFLVTASAGGQSAAVTVMVTPGAPAVLLLTPETATIDVNQPVTFVASVQDAHGNPVTAAVEFAVTGVGSVDASGTFTSASAGAATVTARVPGTAAEDASAVTVNAPVTPPPHPGNGGVVLGAPWWVWILLVIGVGLPLVLFLVLRRRRKGETDESGDDPGARSRSARDLPPPPPPDLPPPPPP